MQTEEVDNEVIIEIVSDPPGANIEVNDDYIGKAPLTIKIHSSYKGEFTRNTSIRALPVLAGHYVQSKFFFGGNYYSNDLIPKRIFLDMKLGPVQPKINVNIDKN